ncbi:MAG: hypothetical protein J6D03_08415 [Clostridia bacterium]|nr:hypothetical protein [Clostridia bacterium]
MEIFSKKEYDVIELPYYIDVNGDSKYVEQMKEALSIDLSFIGIYKEKEIKFSVCFQYYNEEKYEEMLQFLSQHEKKTKIAIKINKDNINDYKIDIYDMANKLHNDEIKKLVMMTCNIPLVTSNINEEDFLYKVKQEAFKRRAKICMPILYVVAGIMLMISLILFFAREYVGGMSCAILFAVILCICIFFNKKAENLGQYSKHVMVYGSELEKIVNDIKEEESKNDLEK